MSFLHKKLKDFKPYTSDDKRKINSDDYNQLSLILKKIAVSNQKSSNMTSNLKEEISELILDTRQNSMKLEKENEELLIGLIGYLDIFSTLEKIMNETQDEHIKESLSICISLFNKNNNKLGITEIPAHVGSEYDNDLHYIVDSEETSDYNMKNKITKILQKGYMRGKYLIRKTQIITAK